mmetsp:Transcript_35647/g.80549  ORF Transcript_35647/g.80549 Transcript_35647/m.80549 type:complete len:139 (+) Transcript_35647:81-497(+)
MPCRVDNFRKQLIAGTPYLQATRLIFLAMSLAIWVSHWHLGFFAEAFFLFRWLICAQAAVLCWCGMCPTFTAIASFAIRLLAVAVEDVVEDRRKAMEAQKLAKELAREVRIQDATDPAVKRRNLTRHASEQAAVDLVA